MKIEKSSWHYKMVENHAREAFEDIPTNLCPYFWRVAYICFCHTVTVLAFTVICALGCFVLTEIIMGTYYWVATGFPHAFWSEHPEETAIPPAGVLTLALLLFLGSWDSIKRYLSGKVRHSNNLVIARARAWKDGVCPQLEFVGEEENEDNRE